MQDATPEPLLEEQRTTNTEVADDKSVDTLTVLVEVLDMSGSMADGGFIEEVRNGYNHYIEENAKLPGRAVVFTVLFDTHITMVVDGVPVEDVPELTSAVYHPRGGTALNDAVAFAISSVDEWIQKQPKDNKPDNVVVEIQTDGEENSSVEYSRHDKTAMAAFRELIGGKEASGWVFSYIGTSADAIGKAVEMGISAGMAAQTSRFMSKNAVGNNAYYSAKLDLMSNVRSAAPGAAAVDSYCFTSLQKSAMTGETPPASLLEEEKDD